jgi:hypothetical protein
MVWTQEDIDAYKATRANREGNAGKVDDFVNSAHSLSSSSHHRRSLVSPMASGTRSSMYRRSSVTAPGEEPLRSPEWIGMGSPTGKRRSWKVKSIRNVEPAAEAAAAPEIPDIMED